MASASAGGNPLPRKQLAQVHAVHELHQQVVKPARLPEVVNGDDVRVVQPRQRLGLAREPLGKLRVLLAFRREDLERHEPVQRFCRAL